MSRESKEVEELFGFAFDKPEVLQAMKVDKIRMDWIAAKPILRLSRIAHLVGTRGIDFRAAIDELMMSTGHLPP